MKFIKMHGAGNDYIYFNCLKQKIEDPAALSVRLSDRHKGVGGDGIVLILPSEQADFRMRMFNADGSEGKMCGNAARCVGKYVHDLGLTEKTELTLETLSGVRTLHLHLRDGATDSITVDMGRAILEPEKIPVRLPGERVVDRECRIAGKEYRITCVSMGNPHCVVFCEDVAGLPLAEIGPEFETNALFPDRTNTEFVRPIDRRTLEVRVWERGSGETMACGTGACASAVAATLCGHTDRFEDVSVHLPGGTLSVRWLEDGTVLLTGPAEFVFKGELLV